MGNRSRTNGKKERKTVFPLSSDYKWKPSDHINIILVIAYIHE